jgi:ADP-ribose pyrophosphatase YjhB (NUDIX family)
MKYNIYKSAGILVKDRKFLVCRPKSKDIFYSPGGRLEEEENPIEALKRELKEDLDIFADESDMEEFGTFYAPAAGDEKSLLRIDVFLVKKWKGEMRPNGEIEEIAWINGNKAKAMKLGSIFEHQVMPKLLELQLID